MRKQIAKTIKWEDIDSMSYHDILNEMGFTITEDFTEEEAAAIWESVPCPKEVRNSQVVFRSIKGKMYMIIYLYIIKLESGQLMFTNWDDVLTYMNNTRGTDKNIYRINEHILNDRLMSVRVDIDVNAFKIHHANAYDILDYTDLWIVDAVYYLHAITGLDKDTLWGFCKGDMSNLIDEINAVGSELRTNNNWRYEETCKKINKTPLKYNRIFSNSDSPRWGKKDYVLPCDFVYYLLIIKTVNNFNDDGKKLVTEYLKSDCQHDIESHRSELLSLFKDMEITLDMSQSICYPEHLFALNNYFNIDYVIDPAATPSTMDSDNCVFEPSSITSPNPDDYAGPLATVNTDSPAQNDNDPVQNTHHRDSNPSDFVSIAESQIDLYRKKNRDYGNATDKLFKKYGFTYYRIMLEQKLQRIESITDNGDEHNFESLEDSLLDMSNYCLLAVESLRKKKQGK